MKRGAAGSLAATVLFAAGYAATSLEPLLSLAITTGTAAYHLGMRLAVGAVFRRAMKNRADYTARRYRVGRAEMRLYEKLGVRRWKRRLPTYDAASFDPGVHSWEEIAGAMCTAELVHEANAALSLLPIAAGKLFGAYPVFIATSLAAAAFDLIFVILQRYNRSRVVQMLARREKR